MNRIIRNQLGPRMPPGYYKNYRIASPVETHYRRATCQEINCEAYRDGWTMHKEKLLPALLYAATHSGRKFKEVSVSAGQTYLVFEPGQTCFRAPEHKISLERPEWYFVGRGLYTVFNTRAAKQHTKPEFWIEDMSEHLETIRHAIED